MRATGRAASSALCETAWVHELVELSIQYPIVGVADHLSSRLKPLR